LLKTTHHHKAFLRNFFQKRVNLLKKVDIESPKIKCVCVSIHQGNIYLLITVTYAAGN